MLIYFDLLKFTAMTLIRMPEIDPQQRNDPVFEASSFRLALLHIQDLYPRPQGVGWFQILVRR
jgi:hypothetical protein